MSFCVLGSGSGGNCSVLLLHRQKRKRPEVILVDLGLGVRETEKRLRERDLSIEQVRAVVLTHFDGDHFRPVWINRIRRFNWRIHFHMDHWPIANRIGAPEFDHEAFDAPFEITPGVSVHPISFAHDAEGTTGFRFDCEAGRFGFATDLGHAPKHIFDLFHDLTLLAIESNYCPQLQVESNRPTFLKQRIMGGRGHLSNEQSIDAVQRIAEISPDLQRIVLLHLSRECNSPGRILNLYSRFPELSRRLVISSQAKPIEWINIDTPGAEPPIVHTQHELFSTESNGRSSMPST